MTQTQALDILKMGKNVFLTGSAGSGKTFVLNKYIDYLKKHKVGVGVTAATGIAATHLGGTTIHSWSGIGIKDKLSDHDIKSLLKKAYLKKHFLNSDVLIIDEISMLHARQLDLINNLCQAFRKSIQPFGGLQVILSGDFFQLPPIARDNQPVCWVTQSEIWQNMNLNVCYLTEQYRQEDSDFLNILNEIRNGKVGDYSRQLLLSRINKTLNFKLEPTKLYTHNIDVDAINGQELNKIKGEAFSYKMQSHGRPVLCEVLKKSCLSPEKLIIKIGAKVMFIKNNFEQGIVNGTIGKIIGIDKETSNCPIVETSDGREIIAHPSEWTIEEDNRTIAQIRQIPLRLAWAITVHKSQGLSLDLAEMDLSKSFTAGMGYVALSRVRSLSGLALKGFNELALEVDENVLNFDKEFRLMSDKIIQDLQVLPEAEKIKIQKSFVNISFDSSKKIRQLAEKKIPNHIKTRDLIKKKMLIFEIAKELNFTKSTIINHIEKLVKTQYLASPDIAYLLPHKKDLIKI
ncbi:AAA family ATPase, partial [Candidatus Parcubacteria bacterium]|nr:AAA family ATPase [Patescibacteria group bacterium]MCG2686756.1 AAA family ATPase [Candidatus Parcubacteria bacterium]